MINNMLALSHRLAAHATFAAVILFPALIRAEVSTDRLRSIADREFSSLEQIYTTIHKNPELSLQEEKTAALLASELRKLGYKVTEKVGGHGVVAVLENGKGTTLLLRADMDALPVKEDTGAAYASQVIGKTPGGQTVPVMHACGHDIHVTTLIGTARAMVELKDQWKGTLVLIGQPAEEVGRGARAMLTDGLFERFPRPDYCLALHVDPTIETGKVGYVSGFAMANVDSIDVTIRGVGGHGAQPHQTKDPIVMAAQAILALQTIDSREINPIEPVVVTVGSIHGGTKHNIIPDQVTMQITVRTYKDEMRDQTLKAIERIIKGVAQTAGVPEDRAPIIKLVNEDFTPTTYNTPELTARTVNVLRKVIGDSNLEPKEPTMGGEDFGRYGRVEPKIPIFMFRLGSIRPEQMAESRRKDGKPLPSLHSPIYLPDRSCIKTGVVTLTAAALDLLK